MKLHHWHFTILLLISYIALFHLWQRLSGQWIFLTGLAACAILVALLLAASRHGYFVNRWDRAFHAAVIVDLLLEGFFQEHFGFYWCALGFGLLITGYRLLVRHRSNAVVPEGNLAEP